MGTGGSQFWTCRRGRTVTLEFGEDMSFCLRLVAQDTPMWVNTAVKTTHDKGGVYLDEETYLIQQAIVALDAAMGAEDAA